MPEILIPQALLITLDWSASSLKLGQVGLFFNIFGEGVGSCDPKKKVSMEQVMDGRIVRNCGAEGTDILVCVAITWHCQDGTEQDCSMR